MNGGGKEKEGSHPLNGREHSDDHEMDQTVMSLRHLMKWLAVGVGVVSLYGIFHVLPVEDLIQADRLQSFLEEMGPFAPVGFIGLMVLAVVISPIPSLPLDLAAGAMFGPLWGTVYAVLGAEIGAIISFLIGRMVGRDALSRWLNLQVTFCQKCSDHHLMILVFLARLLPIFSFDLVSYGAGLTRMSLKVFAVSTLFGMIPPTFALTYLGGSVPTLEWPLILSALVLTGLLLIMPKLLLRYRGVWWVQMIQGNAPGPAIPSSEDNRLPSLSNDGCEWCGDGLTSENSAEVRKG